MTPDIKPMQKHLKFLSGNREAESMLAPSGQPETPAYYKTEVVTRLPVRNKAISLEHPVKSTATYPKKPSI